MDKKLYLRFERCLDCKGCEVACARENQGRSLIRVVPVGGRFGIPLTCRHCNPAPCALVCPEEAIRIQGDAVRLEPERCTGCSLCVVACPFGVMMFDPATSKAAHCHQCASRQVDGLAPACALTCPSSALLFGSYSGFAGAMRSRAGKRLQVANALAGGDA